jgi:hypothetical protein
LRTNARRRYNKGEEKGEALVLDGREQGNEERENWGQEREEQNQTKQNTPRDKTHTNRSMDQMEEKK